MPGRHHYVATNQCAARECQQLYGRCGFIDPPNHNCADVGVGIVYVDDGLRRRHRYRVGNMHPSLLPGICERYAWLLRTALARAMR